MQQSVNRRAFIQAAAATAVVGFSEEAGAWVPAGLEKLVGKLHGIPHLDGELLTDEASRLAVSTDLGGLEQLVPFAVLRPRSVNDVAKMVKFCLLRGIKVAARGQGHSTGGQGLVKNGLLIDMSTLGAIKRVGNGFAEVEGGALWRDVLAAALAKGQTPPVLTGYQGLSVGGTLSMGGISGMAYKRGVQIEHVLELTVVTGLGIKTKCSPTHNRPLFDAVLGGVGQYGIIVEAKVKLVPAKQRALDTTLQYDDLDTFLRDMRTLVDRGELDMVWGGMRRDANGWLFELFTTVFYDPPHTPNVDHMLRGLSYNPDTRVDIDGTYFDYHTRVDGQIAFLRDVLGVWTGFMKPWFDVFLPWSRFKAYAEDLLATMTPEDVGNFGFVLLFPLKASTIHQPMFRIPKEELVVLWDITTSANFPGFDQAFASQMRARNMEWFRKARALGGTRYPIGTLDFSHADWRHHYGPEWTRAQLSKLLFDPTLLLTPGPGIF